MNKNLIAKLKLFLSDKEIASFIEQSEANEKLQELVRLLTKVVEDTKKNSFEGIEMIKGDKGEPGKDGEHGKTPTKGIDYYTKEEKQSFRSELIELITPEKGLDYFTQEEVDSIIEAVTPLKGKDYFTKTEIQKFKKEVTPKKGEDYFDGEPGKPGEDGREISQKDLLEKINDFDHEVELKVLKGLEPYIKKLIPKNLGTQYKKHGGGASDVWHTGDGLNTHKLTVSDTAPVNPIVGDLWVDTT